MATVQQEKLLAILRDDVGVREILGTNSLSTGRSTSPSPVILDADQQEAQTDSRTLRNSQVIDERNSRALTAHPNTRLLSASTSNVAATPAQTMTISPSDDQDVTVNTTTLNIPGFNPNKYGNPSRHVVPKPSSAPSSRRQDELTSSSLQSQGSTPSSRQPRVNANWNKPDFPASSQIHPQPLHSDLVPSEQPLMNDRAPLATSRTGDVSTPIQRAQEVESRLSIQSEMINTCETSKMRPELPNTTSRAVDSTSPPSQILQQTPRAQTGGRPSVSPDGPLKLVKSSSNSGLAQKRRRTPAPSQLTQFHETDEEKLDRLKRQGLNQIYRRNKRRDQTETASPATLSFIRSPLSPELEHRVGSRVQHYSKIGQSPSEPKFPSASEHVNQGTRDDYHASQINPEVETKLNYEPQSSAPRPAPATNTPAALGPPSRSAQKSDFYVPDHARDKTPIRDPRWASSADIKPEDVSVDSNAWGSFDLDVSTASDDSIQAIHDGNVRRKANKLLPQSSLVGWDGKMQPPPIDWNDRPRFDNNAPDFKNSLNQWTDDVVDFVLSPSSPDLSFHPIPNALVMDISNHADGLGMVSGMHMVDSSTAQEYGFSREVGEIARSVQPITAEEISRIDVIDVNDPANEMILEETTEAVVQRFLAHCKIIPESLTLADDEPSERAKPGTAKDLRVEDNPNAPVLNIYLRPACRSDIPQLTRIYNWYIEHATQPAETSPIDDGDMKERHDHAVLNKYPFIVAVEKAKGASFRGTKRSSRQNSHQTQNTNQQYRGIVREEKIVGWASGQDFTASDFVERISAELEIYVAPEARKLGIGQCLMDKLLDATDRGYIKRGGYDFCCASEQAHLYCGGGGRDLHKLYFILRKWHNTRKNGHFQIDGKATGNVSHKTAPVDKASHRQDDGSETWLQKWIESRGFEVEGTLKQAGAKNGRYIDIVHLGRSTMWQPRDGDIPEPLPGTV